MFIYSVQDNRFFLLQKSPASSLRMRIPKAGAYLDSTLKTDPGDPYALPDDPYALPDDDENQNNNNQESCLKLKVSNGKIIRYSQLTCLCTHGYCLCKKFDLFTLYYQN